jgi:hypothetical protein
MVGVYGYYQITGGDQVGRSERHSGTNFGRCYGSDLQTYVYHRSALHLSSLVRNHQPSFVRCDRHACERAECQDLRLVISGLSLHRIAQLITYG